MLAFILLASIASASSAPKVEPPCIGIDLGTTYSVVGIWQNDKVEIIANEMGNRITPSVVAFTPTERLVGDAARHQMTTNYRNTIYAVKRLMGRTFNDPSVQKDRRMLSYDVVEDTHGRASVRVEHRGESKVFKPEEISAMILQKMREVAQTYLGKDVINAVVTVPAYFSDAQRQATKDAGTIAGLNVVRIINEPTAAAIAFGLDQTDEERRVLVFDLGGGTFDVSVLSIDNGFFEVEATNGDTHLGGEDFDNRIIMHLAAAFEKQTGKNIRSDQRALARLRKAAEEAKRRLSSQPEARVEVDNLVDGVDFSERLTRGKFEELCADLFRATLDPVKAVLADASLEKSDIHEVVLVGGSTRIPKIQALIKEFFNGKEPNRGINPDEAVAYGAAVHAAVLSGATRNAVMLVDVIPLSLGIETIGGVMLPIIPRNTIIPTQKEQVVTTTSEQQVSIDFQVYEGERGMTKDNRLLGRFTLSGIKPAPRGVPQVRVQMAVDENGILHVTATDLDGGASESVEITNDASRLTKEEVERMVEEAKEFEEEDRRLREKAQSRVQLEQTISEYRQRMTTDEFKESTGEEERAIVEDALTEATQWLQDNSEASTEEFQERAADLRKRVSSIMERVPKASEKKPTPSEKLNLDTTKSPKKEPSAAADEDDDDEF